jgi:hypothetical protein
MPYCPNCGTEHKVEDKFCSKCGEALRGISSESQATGQNPIVGENESEGWSWLDPKGPFRSPRITLNYFNAVGLILIIIALVLIVAGVDSPYAFLPDPLGILVVVYLLAVVFVGLPLAGILLLTDNVLGFLRHG